MVDLDGVIYPWARAVYVEQCVYANETRSYEEFWQNFEHEHNEIYFDNLVSLKHLYGTQPPNKRNVNFLIKLTAQGHKLYYVTNRPLSVQTDTELWLARYDIPQRQNLVFTKNKIPVCNSLGIQLVFEDRIRNVKEFCLANFNVIAVQDAVTPKFEYPCPVFEHLFEAERIMKDAY